jgi:hypothetical protein
LQCARQLAGILHATPSLRGVCLKFGGVAKTGVNSPRSCGALRAQADTKQKTTQKHMNTFVPPMPGKPFDPLAASRLPGRLNAEQAARLLGFQAHDIPVLVRAKLLEPLGKPVPSAPKYFAGVALDAFRCDCKWLDAASKAISKYWRDKNSRRTDIATPSDAPESVRC